ncbi:MAG: AMP-binding protein [Burkholderiales bacterium]|nr:AMP-binding protein [Burkholderiales bacterium]
MPRAPGRPQAQRQQETTLADTTLSFQAARQFLLEHRSDYRAAVAGFRWPELNTFNWALDHFDALASDQPALWIVRDGGGEEKHSFREMSERSNRVANWLRAQGVRRGDRVLLMLGNELALWESMLALMKLGAVMIPATTLLARDDIQDRLDRGHVRHVICGAANVGKFDGVAGSFTRIAVGQAPGWLDFGDSRSASPRYVPEAPTPAGDPMLLYFTSGTTSKPKLVLHSHQSYPVGHLSTMYWIGVQPGDVHLNISSPGWGKHAWSSFFAPWNAGACIFVYQYERFDAPTLLDVLVRHGISSFCAPPTVWRMLIQQDLGAWKVRVREALSAGEPLNPEVIERVREAWGVTIRDGFGQTETTCVVGNSPRQPLKMGSMGRPMPGYPVVLLDEDGNPSDQGELCLALAQRPLGLMLGYADDPAKTADVQRDGHYHTGDVASRDGEGYITYVGRADDVFKSSDYRLSPFELESVLLEHPAVAEAAVIPSPDPLRLAVPKAVIVLAAGTGADRATALSILAFCRERLAPYKRIRRIEFAELPKTISGKIQRGKLRRAEEERRAGGGRGAAEYWDEDFAELKGR